MVTSPSPACFDDGLARLERHDFIPDRHWANSCGGVT
jgi:hypothetical protein